MKISQIIFIILFFSVSQSFGAEKSFTDIERDYRQAERNLENLKQKSKDLSSKITNLEGEFKTCTDNKDKCTKFNWGRLEYQNASQRLEAANKEKKDLENKTQIATEELETLSKSRADAVENRNKISLEKSAKKSADAALTEIEKLSSKIDVANLKMDASFLLKDASKIERNLEKMGQKIDSIYMELDKSLLGRYTQYVAKKAVEDFLGKDLCDKINKCVASSRDLKNLKDQIAGTDKKLNASNKSINDINSKIQNFEQWKSEFLKGSETKVPTSSGKGGVATNLTEPTAADSSATDSKPSDPARSPARVESH